MGFTKWSRLHARQVTGSVTVVIGRDRFVQSVALDAKPSVGAAIEDRNHPLRIMRINSNQIGGIAYIGLIFVALLFGATNSVK